MKTLVPIESKNLIASLLVGLASILPGGAAVLQVPSQYATIQGAVEAAASGDTIRIAAGVYEEQVLITSKNLTLAGAPGAVLKAKPGLLETLLPMDPTTINLRPVLGIVFADNVVVRGLVIDGARLGEINSAMFGVLFHGSSGRLENCTVKGFREESALSVGEGFAAGNFEHLARPVQQVQVSNNIFEDNWISVEVTGRDSGETGPNPNVRRLTFVIQDNVITGAGPTDAGVQTGIEIQPGAFGAVRRNRIADHDATGPAYTFSYGIHAYDKSGDLLPLQPVRYEGNTFRNNQEHIVATSSDNSVFLNNNFQGSSTGTRPNGMAVSGNNLWITGNNFGDLPTGITLFGDDPDFGTALGITTNAKVIANGFCHVTTPIDIEPLVTGTVDRANRICSRRWPHDHTDAMDDDH